LNPFGSIVRQLSNKNEKQSNEKKSSQSYQVPEYYGYNMYSYFDIETEMLKHRLPQPSTNQLPNIDYTWSQVPPKDKKK